MRRREWRRRNYLKVQGSISEVHHLLQKEILFENIPQPHFLCTLSFASYLILHSSTITPSYIFSNASHSIQILSSYQREHWEQYNCQDYCSCLDAGDKTDKSCDPTSPCLHIQHILAEYFPLSTSYELYLVQMPEISQ